MIGDTVAQRRMLARSVVPSNIDALRRRGFTVENINDIEHRVEGKVAFFPRNGFWRFLDGSRQGYGASRLIPALAVPGEQIAVKPLDPMIEALRKPVKKKTEKLAPGRDSAPVELETTTEQQCAESGASASSRLPAVWP